MVRTHRKTSILVALIVSLLLLSIPVAQNQVHAAELVYHLDKEWAKVWVNSDGSIDILYNVTLTIDQGSIGIITIGMPAKGFTAQYAKDLSEASLQTSDASSGDYYGVDVTLRSRVYAPSSVTIVLYAIVPNMVYEDSQNPGNVGLQFSPSDWEVTIRDLRTLIVLPQGVKQNEIKTNVNWDGLLTEDSSYVVYWERKYVGANQKYLFGVSFPKQYVTSYVTTGPNVWLIAAIILSVAGLIFVVILILRRRKMPYDRPRVMAESLGPARGLTAVEAAVVLDQPPVKVLTMILFGLTLKRALAIVATIPLVRVRVEKRVEQPPQLRYYDLDFLRAVEEEGTLDEGELALTYTTLKQQVDRKLRGYSREETVNYYKSTVEKAWKQLSEAGTPELRGEVLDKELDWLILDQDYRDRFRTTLPPDTIIVISRPEDYWYPRLPRPLPSPAPTPMPTPTTPPTAPREPLRIPGSDVADSIVKGIEDTSNRLVKNVESFTKTILPPPPPTKREPIRRSATCACACAHCACACACVGCACACASGKAR